MNLFETKECRFEKVKDVPYVVFKKWGSDNQMVHCFTSKHGGNSTGDLCSLNLGFNRGDKEETVIANYQSICDAIGVELDSLVISKQIHETNIVEVTYKDKGNGILHPNKWESVDGIYTRERGITLVTHYADCVPLFFYAPKYSVIGLAHSGWRGTVMQIGNKMIEEWTTKYHIPPSEIEVGIGPSIGPCCFEVHADVADEFLKIFKKTSFIVENHSNGKYNINLWECNRQSLINLGISPEKIYVSEMCTCCHDDVFFSQRKTEGKRGALAALMCLKQ
ncbi:MAG: peptidoglycan editing factor PgeF [Cellulosilyticaceae bacterium]